MAKYILLSFEDDADADAFVNAMEPGHDGGALLGDKPRVIFLRDEIQDGQIYGGFEKEVFVRGVYKRPTKYCDCTYSRNGKDGFTRGKKYGWWVHSRCGKPKKGWAEGDLWYHSLGKNLLPVTPKAPEWRGEGVRGHTWDAKRKVWIDVQTGEARNHPTV